MKDKQKQLIDKMDELCHGTNKEIEEKLKVVFNYCYENKIVNNKELILYEKEITEEEKNILLESTIGYLRANEKLLNQLYQRIIKIKGPLN